MPEQDEHVQVPGNIAPVVVVVVGGGGGGGSESQCL